MTLNYPAGPRYDTKLSSRGSSVQGPSGHKGDGVCEGRSDGASQNPASSKGTGGRKITQVEFISRWQTGKGEGLQCGMAWSFVSIVLQKYLSLLGVDWMGQRFYASHLWVRKAMGISIRRTVMKSEGSPVGMAWNFVLEGYVVSLGLY
jgi:hypothetical protein